ncbi:hypothetical protein FE257_004345 [Aspergillus nanangensis]|uniref:Uncharacterized protein n=1 Tax=Aspergillus nanangensis TaxID=2582783 RepID=A0AAD4CAR3_ASPNN|nr:hypothetical protein FE257_004345 [Aspergillus nanangensis]
MVERNEPSRVQHREVPRDAFQWFLSMISMAKAPIQVGRHPSSFLDKAVSWIRSAPRPLARIRRLHPYVILVVLKMEMITGALKIYCRHRFPVSHLWLETTDYQYARNVPQRAIYL